VFVVLNLGTYNRTVFDVALVWALLALSLVVLTGWVGQISLAQAAFYGFGAYMTANYATKLGLSFPLVVVLIPITLVPLGVVVGLPAIRARGFVLAITTLAFGWAAFQTLFQYPGFTGQHLSPGTATLGPPDLFGVDISGPNFAYVVLAVTATVFFAVRNVGRYRAGGAMLAVRESEEGAAVLGINASRQKLWAFALSAAIAGLAGCLGAYQLGAVSSDSYTPFVSFQILLLAVLGGLELPVGALLAGIFYAVGPEIWSKISLDWIGVVSGLGVVGLMIRSPSGIAAQWARLLGKIPLPFRDRSASLPHLTARRSVT
jgi:ABC-type branched-subunit amino acid transport system permease subunit